MSIFLNSFFLVIYQKDSEKFSGLKFTEKLQIDVCAPVCRKDSNLKGANGITNIRDFKDTSFMRC